MSLPAATDDIIRGKRYLFGSQTSNRMSIVHHTFTNSRETELCHCN